MNGNIPTNPKIRNRLYLFKENMIFLLNQYHSLTWLCLTLTNNKLNLRSLSPLLQNVPTLPVCSWFRLGISHPPQKKGPGLPICGETFRFYTTPLSVSLTFIPRLPRLPNWPFELQKAIFVVKSIKIGGIWKTWDAKTRQEFPYTVHPRKPTNVPYYLLEAISKGTNYLCTTIFNGTC